MRAERDEQDQPTSRRRDKFTLHPRTFEEAVRELWEAEPEERDGKREEEHQDCEN